LLFARLVKRAKIQHVRFHDLRHSFGTLALASGVDLKTVSAALGHSTISMTANTYIHAIESLQRDAADRIDVMIGRVVDAAIAGGSGQAPASPGPPRAYATVSTKKKPRGKGFRW
jgi:hypothetical protein